MKIHRKSDDKSSSVRRYKSLKSSLQERNPTLSIFYEDNLRFDQFCDKIQFLFGNDIRTADLKNIYKKISTNPDVLVDWSEIFGYDGSYFNIEANESDMATGPGDNEKFDDTFQVFMNTFKFRIGDASGDKAKRDIILGIACALDIESFITVSQKGYISIWNNMVNLFFFKVFFSKQNDN